MVKFEFRGVQKIALHADALFAESINLIPDHRTPDERRVNANLVRPSSQ
jgi:hypothetical protein